MNSITSAASLAADSRIRHRGPLTRGEGARSLTRQPARITQMDSYLRARAAEARPAGAPYVDPEPAAPAEPHPGRQEPPQSAPVCRPPAPSAAVAASPGAMPVRRIYGQLKFFRYLNGRVTAYPVAIAVVLPNEHGKPEIRRIAHRVGKPVAWRFAARANGQWGAACLGSALEVWKLGTAPRRAGL